MPDENSFAAWLNENRAALKTEYREYKENAKFDGYLPEPFNAWAQKRYEANLVSPFDYP